MALTEEYNFEYLVNEAERLVIEILEEELHEQADSVCRCQDCVLDMAAFALNNVKPLYRVSLIGKLYAHTLDNSEYAEVVRESVKSAVEKISKNPSHE